MVQMDKQLLRGAKAMLEAGAQNIECDVWTSIGIVPCKIVGASFAILTVERKDNERRYEVPLANAQVEDEVAETLRGYYERVMANVNSAVQFGQGAASRLGTYSQGVIWNGGRGR